MKKKYIVFLLFIFCSFFWEAAELSCQDLHFSQYNQASSLVNPALTGVSSVLKATVIYKDQWQSVTSSPYKTFGASFEMRLKNSSQRKTGKYLPKSTKNSFSRMAVGLSFFSDKAGDGNMGSTQVNLSLATFVPTGENSALSVGLQASVVQRQIDFTKLIFPDQYSGNGYNSSISNGENASSQNITYPDFAGGINWHYGNGKKKKEEGTGLKANIGASIYHINQPKQDFLNGSNQTLNAKYIMHADFLIGITNTNLAIVPTYIFTIQGPAREMIEGMMLKYYLKSAPLYYGVKASSAIGFGVSYRNKDAAIFSMLLEYGQYAIGFSYDLNTSMLNAASNTHGGPEVFIRFVTPNPFSPNKNPSKRYNL